MVEEIIIDLINKYDKDLKEKKSLKRLYQLIFFCLRSL